MGLDPGGIQAGSSPAGSGFAARKGGVKVPGSSQALRGWEGFYSCFQIPKNMLKYGNYPLCYRSVTWSRDRAVPFGCLGAPG